MRPSVFQVGGVLYWTILTRNPDTLVAKDADSTPSVAVTKNGTPNADSVTVTKRSATTGIYDCSYNPAAESEGDTFHFLETATVTGTTTASQTYPFGWVARCVAVERGTDGANTTAPANSTIADISSRIPAALEGGRIAAVLDSDAQAMVAAFNAMRSGNVFTAPALANAPTGSGGDATLAKQNEILTRLSEVTIGVTGYAQLDIHGVLQLKRGHTAILTFTSSTSNIVSDMSAETVKVFFGIKDAAGRSWLSLEGTKLVNTGLQSVRFTITAALAAAMINGEHFFDVVAVYGYNASTTPKYTSLEPFTSGRAKVTDLYVDI